MSIISRVSTKIGTGIMGPSSVSQLYYLVVGGGGGGGASYRFTPAEYAASAYGGGGGGGGLLYDRVTLNSTDEIYTVSVGGGGSGGYNAATSGGNSILSGSLGTVDLTAYGGGRGGGSSNQSASGGASGGSGGGATIYYSNVTGGGDDYNMNYSISRGSGVSGQGYSGAVAQFYGVSSVVFYMSGGGGGAGGVGGRTDTGFNAQLNGGYGKNIDITGTSITYSGGGAGGRVRRSVYNTPYSNDGVGSHGGGNTANRGGGGSTAWSTSGNNGNSGVVIIKYPNKYQMNGGAGLTFTVTDLDNYKVATFTNGTGNISFTEA